MWTLFINAMLTQSGYVHSSSFKAKMLSNGFQRRSWIWSDVYRPLYNLYSNVFRVAREFEFCRRHSQREATEKRKSAALYELLLSVYIIENDEPKAYEVFRKAHRELGVESVPIWQKTIQFYKTRYEDCAKRLLQIYREACQQTDPKFGVFKGDFMEFCMVNMSLEKTRAEYDKLSEMPPPSLQLHMKMAEIEARLVVRVSKNFLDVIDYFFILIIFQTPPDVDRWRLCYENATFYFGKTHIDVWLDYLKFERDHGDPKRLSNLNQRAKSSLESSLVDEFITQYAMLSTIT